MHRNSHIFNFKFKVVVAHRLGLQSAYKASKSRFNLLFFKLRKLLPIFVSYKSKKHQLNIGAFDILRDNEYQSFRQLILQLVELR